MKLNTWVLIVLLSSTSLVLAQDVVMPNTFSTGERVYANKMNENFEVLSKAVNRKSEIMASVGYSKTPTVKGVAISNVLVNGGMITAPVEKGSTINIVLNYDIVDPGCPNCIDQIQVGFVHLSPVSCVYNGIPGKVGASGSGKLSITAPSESGTYYIGVDRSQQYSCIKSWLQGVPKSNQWIAAITVR